MKTVEYKKSEGVEAGRALNSWKTVVKLKKLSDGEGLRGPDEVCCGDG